MSIFVILVVFSYLLYSSPKYYRAGIEYVINSIL